MATELNLFGRDDQVTVKNPTNKDFLFSWNSKQYKVLAGKVARIPGYMAEHYVKELTNEMIQRQGEKAEKHLMDENYRKPYYDRIVVEVIKLTSLENGDAETGDVTTLGETFIADSEAKEIAKAAGTQARSNGRFAKKDKGDTGEDLTPAIEEPLSDDDLPEDNMEAIAAESAKKRAQEDAGTITDPENDDAFPDLT